MSWATDPASRAALAQITRKVERRLFETSPISEAAMIESPIVGPTPLEKAETALRYLESIIRHDQSRITRQPANGIKSASASLAAAVEIMRREANGGAR